MPNWIVEHIIKPILAARPNTKPFIDGAGNLIYEIGGVSPLVFSAHVDTVHRESGVQPLCVDLELQYIWKEDGEPLGADDAAGCWMLVELIKADVPGMYIFHQGEEKGGIGSRYISDHKKHFFKDKNIAIAFDRRKQGSIITEMSAGRTCSDEFGTALAELLAMGHKIDNTGSFTDTANYRKLVAECTNISIGYDDEHTGRETLDFEYLYKLRDKVIEVGLQLADLPITRDPDKPDISRFASSYIGGVYSGTGANIYGYGEEYEDWKPLGQTAGSGDVTTQTAAEKISLEGISTERYKVADPDDAPWEAAQNLFDVLLALGVFTSEPNDVEGALILDGLFFMATYEPKEFRSHVECIADSYDLGDDSRLGEWQLHTPLM